jgi:ribose-phosphate pyrophosphokinase
LVEAAIACRENKAKTVQCAVSHGCFTPVGLNRLNGAFACGTIDKVYASNSVATEWPLPEKVSVVDISKLFATAIKNIHNNESVSELFRL